MPGLDDGVELVDLPRRLRAPVDVEPDGLEGGGHARLAGGERATAGIAEDDAGRAPCHHGGVDGQRGVGRARAPAARRCRAWGRTAPPMVAWRPVVSMTTGRRIPATTCALVTTSPGATTKPDPSWMTPHPDPATWTVDPSARSTAARADASVGSDTGAAVCGGSPAKTTGKPFWARNRSTPANTDGIGGSTASRARTIRDCCSDRSRRGVLAAVAGCRHHPGDDERDHHGHGHTEDRVDGPEAQPLQEPARARPEQPAHAAHDAWPRRSGRRGRRRALAVPPCTTLATDGASSAPRKRPRQKPAEGEHLHGGAEPEPVDARQRHDDEQHVVDPVHRRRSFPTCDDRDAHPARCPADGVVG